MIGAAVRGYDKTDPAKGAPPEMAQLANDNLVKPMFASYAEGDEFTRSINAITRHAVEEFSMFRFFLPAVWDRFPHLHGMFALADTVTAFVPRLKCVPAPRGRGREEGGRAKPRGSVPAASGRRAGGGRASAVWPLRPAPAQTPRPPGLRAIAKTRSF
jgi:uncharacterized membrane protein YgcG